MARYAILYGQLKEGLHLELIKSPSVSRALTYKELFVSAKNEEHRQHKLKKRQRYVKHLSQPSEQNGMSNKSNNSTEPAKQTKSSSVKTLLQVWPLCMRLLCFKESGGCPPGGKTKASAKQAKSVQNTQYNRSTPPSRIRFHSYFPIPMTVMVYVKYVCKIMAVDPD